MMKRKLTVTSCNVSFDPPDKEWTLYTLGVVGEDGDPIDEEFKSFDNLPLGELIEFDVEVRDHEKYGRSYTLSLPKGMGMKAIRKPDVNGMIVELRQRVARLESQVAGLTGGTVTEAQMHEAAIVGGAMATLPTPDDDIPF